MSGIVGFVDRRGAPADRALLEGLTDLLCARGPDGRGTRVSGPAALGHTLLRTSRQSAGEHQPAALDGHLWITADARLDRRAELIAQIEGVAPEVPAGASDADLILRAYAAWGEECVGHLYGDFAFALWDAPRRTLFCARDHFGVKPFYYADIDSLFLFSNTLDCILAHPEVSGELHDPAIADFLFRGFNSDPATTSYRDVRRLPAAHFLVANEQEIRIERYWSLPVDGRIRYRRREEYVEHFQALFQEAIADRLDSGRTGVWLSGGMDSSAVAATARGLSGEPVDLRAYTMVYESLIPDVERAHAQQVADFLKIPIHFFKMDDLPLFGGLDHPALPTSEPIEDPFFAGIREQYKFVAGECRVMLSGEGADASMHFQMWPYVRDLFRQQDWRNLLADVPAYLRVRSFPWKGIRERFRGLLGANSDSSKFPSWISSELVASLNVPHPPKAANSASLSAGHPFAPMAFAFLSAPQWPVLFEVSDPGVTHTPLEIRYPFLDLRVIDYLLAIPPFPWAFKKRLLREAMVGRLPPATLARPKTPLAGDPICATFGRINTSALTGIVWNEESGRYLNLSLLQKRLNKDDLGDAEMFLRPLCLNFWLQSGRRFRYKMGAEVRNG